MRLRFSADCSGETEVNIKTAKTGTDEITNAIERSQHLVRVYAENGRVLFSRQGHPVSFTSSVVNIKDNASSHMIHVPDEKGCALRHISCRTPGRYTAGRHRCSDAARSVCNRV